MLLAFIETIITTGAEKARMTKPLIFGDRQ
jgi:hypothetical protein